MQSSLLVCCLYLPGCHAAAAFVGLLDDLNDARCKRQAKQKARVACAA